MKAITDFYQELQATKEKLVDTINSILELDVESFDDYFEGHEKIHIVFYTEGGRPYNYIELKVRRYCKNYVLAYTNDYSLVDMFNGEECFWTEEDDSDLIFYVENYIIKIPYEHVALESLFHIANSVYDIIFDEDYIE